MAMSIKEEITQAVKNLGYSLDRYKVEIEPLSYHRLITKLNGKRLGIYDIDKHTFVD